MEDNEAAAAAAASVVEKAGEMAPPLKDKLAARAAAKTQKQQANSNANDNTNAVTANTPAASIGETSPLTKTLVAEEYEKLRHLISRVKGSRLSYSSPNSRDEDAFLTYQLLPVLNRGLEALAVQLESFIKDPKEGAGLQELPNPDSQERRERLLLEAKAMKIEKEPRPYETRFRQRFNPLTWLAQYIMRNHPDALNNGGQSPGLAERDRLLFDGIRQEVEAERGAREAVRRLDDIEAVFHLTRKQNGKFTPADLPLFVDLLDEFWNLSGALSDAIPDAVFLEAEEADLIGLAKRLKAERMMAGGADEAADEEGDGKGSGGEVYGKDELTPDDITIWWRRLLNEDAARLKIEMPPYALLASKMQEKKEREEREAREEAERIKREKELMAIRQEQQRRRDKYDYCRKVAEDDVHLKALLAGEKKLQGVEEVEECVPMRGDHIDCLRRLLILWQCPVRENLGGEAPWEDSDIAAVMDFQDLCKGDLNIEGVEKNGVVDACTAGALLNAQKFEETLKALEG
uniref:Uncharacterized protein n=1 Tax=Chromera velia CCMP2878 TaxID=1169474 RepID=A0A0G4HS01_9ALVE|eukprot:Cvel_8199.t1-p1 / transcript=Cvel_8199.t1 / gene=Cvel_8199 / organism=Chromera_velia_CCMP2878 / gene_product=hypothetical protein / transcript_product=hypothetical protein / location=Cvel_scaffold447:13292-15373(-) / protein_length=517 / sequence_SO=supercontig / SO=protein_coding / is_pseudo=false